MSTCTSVEANGKTKAERYGWNRNFGPIGEFRWIPIAELHVDQKAYQREHERKSANQKIASGWTWIGCGVLIVSERDDGSLWVVDGQQRLLSAKRRNDPNLFELPCFVFCGINIEAEADGFIKINTARGPVSAAAKFKAAITSGDPVSKAIQDMLESDGYSVVEKSVAKFTVSFAASLDREYRLNEQNCREAWAMCVELFEGENVKENVFSALCYLESHLKKRTSFCLRTHWVRESLLRSGFKKLQQSIQQAVAYHGKGGPKVWCEGLLKVVNYRRTCNRIPGCFVE